MNVFIDASVMVAVVAREADASALKERLFDCDRACSSPIALWEAVVATERLLECSRTDAYALVSDLLRAVNVDIVSITLEEADAALIAHEKFGKGRHPAKLNMGDCFAYACAKTNNALLLYKGDDFARTDMA